MDTQSLLDLDSLPEACWYDEWWIVWGDSRYCDSQYRNEVEAGVILADLQKRFPDTEMRIMHVHIEEGHTPFSHSVRPAGMLMWPIDPAKRPRV